MKSSTKEAAAAPAPIRVLVADDDASIRELVTRRLALSNCQCCQAADGVEALRKLLTNEYEVALIDLKMPGADGLDLLHAIEEHQVLTVPVVLSGYGEVANVVEAVRIGAFDFIAKPASLDDVAAVVKRAASHSKAIREAQGITALAEQWTSIFDAVPALMFVVDRNQNVLRGNQMLCEQLGVNTEVVIGQRAQTVTDAASRPLLLPFLAISELPEFRNVTLHHEPWDRHYEVSRVLLKKRGGDTWGAVVVAHDLTEFQRLQTELSHARKLESIGQLAAGIAHEINTPTQYVGDNIRFLQDSFGGLMQLLRLYQQLPDAEDEAEMQRLLGDIDAHRQDIDMEFLQEEIPQAIEESVQGLSRVTEIVLAMKKFSHPGGPEKVPTILREAIESTVTVARNEWKYVADVVTDFDPDLPPVPCHPSDLNQAILNVIVNAADAIEERLGRDASEKGLISIKTYSEGKWAVVEIRDNGCGIPDHVLRRIYDPFFTTKEVGKGSGQGMAITYSIIVEKHKGRLECRSTPGEGAAFYFYLPLNPGIQQ